MATEEPESNPPFQAWLALYGLQELKPIFEQNDMLTPEAWTLTHLCQKKILADPRVTARVQLIQPLVDAILSMQSTVKPSRILQQFQDYQTSIPDEYEQLEQHQQAIISECKHHSQANLTDIRDEIDQYFSRIDHLVQQRRTEIMDKLVEYELMIDQIECGEQNVWKSCDEEMDRYRALLAKQQAFMQNLLDQLKQNMSIRHGGDGLSRMKQELNPESVQSKECEIEHLRRKSKHPTKVLEQHKQQILAKRQKATRLYQEARAFVVSIAVNGKQDAYDTEGVVNDEHMLDLREEEYEDIQKTLKLIPQSFEAMRQKSRMRLDDEIRYWQQQLQTEQASNAQKQQQIEVLEERLRDFDCYVKSKVLSKRTDIDGVTVYNVEWGKDTMEMLADNVPKRAMTKWMQVCDDDDDDDVGGDVEMSNDHTTHI